MNDFDLPRISAANSLGHLDYHRQLKSTNDAAIERIKQGDIASDRAFWPLLVLTSEQTAGRGQHQRSWQASPGSLTFSYCPTPIPSPTINPALGHNSTAPAIDARTPLAVALAVCSAIESVTPIQNLNIKWPNDILLNDKKLAGILIERIPTPPSLNLLPVSVIGIGINVNNDLPVDLSGSDSDYRPLPPIGLRQFLGQPVDLTELLIELLTELARELAELESTWPPAQNGTSKETSKETSLRAFEGPPDRLIERCTARLSTLNQSVQITLPGGESLAGTCTGLGPAGQLLVQTETGLRSIFSGTLGSE